MRHGGPKIDHGRYILNEHGSVTVTSRAGYLDAKAAEQRLVSAIAGVFYLVMIAWNFRRLEEIGGSN